MSVSKARLALQPRIFKQLRFRHCIIALQNQLFERRSLSRLSLRTIRRYYRLRKFIRPKSFIKVIHNETPRPGPFAWGYPLRQAYHGRNSCPSQRYFAAAWSVFGSKM